MITYTTGNLFDSKTEALVNTVNTVGVMGKGIALQFKRHYPENYKKYIRAYKNNELYIGRLLVTQEHTLHEGKRTIINFPTKTHWRKPSEYEYIEAGLKKLSSLVQQQGIRSVAIPPLGAGNGGLDWNKVKALIEHYLDGLDTEIIIYEPNAQIKEALNKERAKLTPARAMLLAVLFDLTKSGEFVSEFAAEKAAYFLQRFGAQEQFGLTFKPYFYGPYSGKIRHVLYYLNGSYITGFSSKDKRPFDELGLITETEQTINKYLNQTTHHRHLATTKKTIAFLRGFYSNFGLELLSTVDFIMANKNISNAEDVQKELFSWSKRKRTLFSNEKFIHKAVNSLNKHLYDNFS